MNAAQASDSFFKPAAIMRTARYGTLPMPTEANECFPAWLLRAASDLSPFGGYKDSGLGRENGIDAVHEYLQVKSVRINAWVATGDPFVLR